jgi:ribonuclease-3
MNDFPAVDFIKISGERIRQLEEWQESQRIRFKKLDLLNLSFIHPSYVNENYAITFNNQRLEFLGDSVLGLSIVSWLYEAQPKASEGELAKLKSHLVSAENLACVARDHQFGKMLLLGKGEENSGGRDKKNILADSLEAFLGAYYLDQGWEESNRLVLEWLSPHNFIQNNFIIDYKSSLQDLCQKLYHEFPRYELVGSQGPEHRKVFTIALYIQSQKVAEGMGNSKKSAEQNAAALAYQIISQNQPKTF